MPKLPFRERILQEAWIGDAVLSLYVRSRILKEQGHIDGQKSIRMTSNQFLNTLGEPSEVEAALGRVYQQQGLDAAFAWIEQKIMPLFLKQEAKRARKLHLPSTTADFK